MNLITSQMRLPHIFQSDTIKEQRDITNLSQKILRASHAKWFWKSDSCSSLKNELSAISPEQLKKVLETISKEKEGLEALEGLAQILSSKQVEECIGLPSCTVVKNVIKEAKLYLEATNGKNTASISAKLSSFLDSIFSVLETIIDTFGIAEFFRTGEVKVDPRSKGQFVMMLLQFFTLMSVIVMPFLGADKASLIVGSILLFISLLSLIYPSIRRAPSALPNAENWTRQYQLGELSVAEGRKNILDEIALTLTANEPVKIYPLLIGKPGIGKSETAKAFVQAIESGGYPKLKGKQVFYINVADLINKDNRSTILSRLSKEMGRHRNNIILIFDQIHLACKRTDTSAFSDQLKALLENKKNNFPYLIGITTEEEFLETIYANNPAFAQKFKQIYVKDTEPVETIRILKSKILAQSPKILMEPNILQTLLQKTKTAFGKEAIQPASSLRILSLCVHRTSESQISDLEKKVKNLRLQLEEQDLLFPQKTEAVKELEEQVRELEIKLQQEQKFIQQLHQKRDQLAEVKMSMYHTALKMANTNPTSTSEVDLNKLLMIHQFFLPTVEGKIKAEAQRLGIKTVIDSTLIDEVIADEQRNIRSS